MATTIGNQITLDGTFTDFAASDMVMTSANTVTGYQVYGVDLNDATLGPTYVIGIDATSSTDQVIAAGTTIYLNTDQSTATGYSPSFAAGKIGAEYEIVFASSNGVLQPFLYSVTSAGVTTELNNGQPLPYAFSSNGESVEIAIPRSLLTPSGGAAPTSIDFAALVNNAVGLPGDFNANPEYVVAAPTTGGTTTSHAVKKVGIVYSATTAALYYGGGAAGESAYADLFMDAQQQARAAGVSYDLLTEADLTNAAELSQYSALIFPDFQDVQSSQAAAIESTLQQLVQTDDIPIITSGDFMTNDQNGNPLSGNSYAAMESVLNLAPSGYGTATYSVQPDPTALSNKNPILSGYTSGQLIGGASGLFAGTTTGYYTNSGYTTFTGYTAPATTIADIDIAGGATLPGVVQSSTGSTDFATTGLFGDSNLLQHVIQNAVFGTTPSLALDITRFKGILNSRTDMDQSQFPSDVSPTTGSGIYTELIPILQSLYNQYDFVGTYFINIGDNTAAGESTNWAVSTPYYDQLLQMGNEIGDHSTTHLLNPPTTTVPATTTADAAAGSTQIKVSALPAYNGATLGMIVTDPSNASAIGANTIVSAVTANSDGTYTLTLTYMPGGYGTANQGVLADIPPGTTLAFAVPTENTNYLSATGTGSFTYAYEFGASKATESSNIGITVAGAAVPGANDYLPDSEQILSYFPTTSSVTGYVSGGWTGVGSGSPNAIGYITPSETSSVYIAPNVTFDFSEVQYEDKTAASSLTDWESLFNQLSANSETPIIVWPWHDYGITDFATGGAGTAPPGYSEALYADYIQYAYNAGYEFVTSEDLAQRVAAEQAATLSETTSGSVITASVTPGAGKTDLGAMALNVVNGAAGQVIKNAGAWYAYDTDSVFLANDTSGAAETFTVTLGATQDDVTHVDSLPMRADLQSVSGDGADLTASFTGSGAVEIHLKTPTTGAGVISIQSTNTGTGAAAPTAVLNGDELTLTFNDGAEAISSASPQGVPAQHTVTITESATAVAGAAFVFTAPTVTIAGTGGVTNQKVVTIAGTVTEPNASQVVGSTITLYDNGSTTPLGTATVQAGVAGGLPTWTATVTLTGDGTHSIVATDVDASHLSGTSAPVVYTLDTAAPTVAITTAGKTTNQAAQTIAGTVTTTEAAAGSTVTLFDNGKQVGTAAVSNGAWSTTVTLSEGANSITASDTDAAGNTGTSAAATFTLDTVAPTIAITTAGATTNQATQTIAGTVTTTEAAAGSTVTVYDNGKQVGTAAVSNGAWSTTVTLAQGANSITASDTDAAGNTGTSDAATFTLATSAPTVAITTAGATTNQATQTIAGTVTANGAAAGSTVTLFDNGKQVGTAAVSNGAWSTTVTLAQGANSITASDTDAAGNTGTSAAATFTLDTVPPTVAITTAGGTTSETTQTIAGTVTTTEAAAGSTVTVYDNGTQVGTAAVSNGAWSTTVALSAGSNSITASDTDAAGNTGASNAVVFTVATSAAGTPTIASESYSGSGATGHWVLGGTATAGATVTVYDGATALGTTTASASGAWTFATAETNGAIRVYTATSAGAASAPVTEGTAGNDVFTFASEAALSAAALINGDGGTDTLQLSAATQLSDSDFAHVQAIQTLGLTGASGVTLGANALSAGVKTVVTGAGATSVTDAMATPATLFVNAAALASSSTLTVAGSGTVSVSALKGALVATGDTGSLSVTATGAAPQSITAGSGNTTVADSVKGGSVTVDASAMGSGKTLTLAGAAAETLTGVAANVMAGNLTGALSVTTKSTSLSITTGTGATLVDAGAMTGTLKLIGPGAVTVTALGGDLDASAEAGALKVTTSGGAPQTVTTGSGSIAIADDSTGALSINAGSLASTSTLTLSGSGAATVSNLNGGLDASGYSGALAVTATGAGSILTGSGTDTVTASKGGNTIAVNGQGDSITVTGHTAADSFVWSATGASPNTSSGHDTITGFAAGKSINDLLNLSAISPGLTIQGALSSGSTVAADSVAWLYSGGGAMVYVNTSSSALSTGDTSLMAIGLAGVSSGLSAANFKA
ncbi:hypothetical protein DFR50_12956 [Roseiarcus fermentans]|uniref:Uncharacterized protein n=1 Tax=Roseiarcus fermentans TaxID=1473586 RepID=A0A366EZ11_9HYPH|nr:Ig-like domain-containing protein [Roseiarcus fermentans]RBP07126.1 hypothetical protein DFR50_12956 [Roseiarcus fermentans]